MYHIVDLSHTLNSDIPVYPGTPSPRFEQATSIENEGFNEYYMHFTNHSGTHMDFPAHVFKDGKTIAYFPVEHFTGQGSIIDCRGMKEIPLDMIETHISPETEVLILYTGWDQYWQQEAYFKNFPVLQAEAASLIAESGLKAIGSDMISFDKVGDDALPNHKILLGKDVLLIENLTNLATLLDKNFEVMFFPLPIMHADASPLRVVAKIN